MSSFGGDPQVKTIFTADATSAKKGAKEAADAVQESADKQKKATKGIGDSFSFSGLKNAVAGIRAIGASIAAAVAVGVGLSKVIDSWANRAEDARKQLDDLTASARAFGETALFNAKSGGLDDTQKSISALREGAQKEIETLVAKTADAQKGILGIFKSFAGLGPSIEEQAAAATQAIEQLNSQVNAAAEQIEKDAAAKKAADRAAAEKKANDESLDRADKYNADAAAIAAGAIEDERERLAALQRIEQEANAKRLDEAKTAEERDAVFALGLAKFEAYQAALTKIAADENKKREEDTARSVAEQVSEFEALRSVIDSAYQAQQQFSQSLTSGLGADITRIADALSLYGGWKK